MTHTETFRFNQHKVGDGGYLTERDAAKYKKSASHFTPWPRKEKYGISFIEPWFQKRRTQKRGISYIYIYIYIYVYMCVCVCV